jgi:hypothetical protein
LKRWTFFSASRAMSSAVRCFSRSSRSFIAHKLFPNRVRIKPELTLTV